MDQIDGGQQVGVTLNAAHDYLMKEYTVKEAGYAYVYVSNETTTLVDVYFDDVKMTFTPTNIIQANEYYPYGMQTANSWTRENVIGNNFLHNGGTELNATSNLYDLEFRNYDPVLGRLMQIDPLASGFSSFTPYNYAYNNPIFWNDPSGAVGASPGEPDYVQPRDLGLVYAAFRNFGFGSLQGHITPGSGGNWADGWAYADWSPNGGSQMYQDHLAAGATDLGGKQ